MSKNSDLNINVTAETKQASDSLKDISSQIDKLIKSSQSYQSKMMGLSGVINVYEKVAHYVGKAIAVTGEWISLHSIQEQTETRLQATLRATGNAIGLSTTEMYAMADGLARVTTFQDQTIIGMQQVFVASGRISREALPQVTEETPPVGFHIKQLH